MAVAYGRQVYAVLFSGGWIGRNFRLSIFDLRFSIGNWQSAIGNRHRYRVPIRIGAGVDIAEVIMSDCSRESRFIGGGRIGLIELS
jgi:hypothetical protein